MRKMKDSGIAWIGEIPEEWETRRISSCFTEVKEKNAANTSDNALQFKMGRIIRKPVKWDGDEVNETYSAYTLVHPGVIMVNGLNLEFDFVTQRVAIVEEDGIITSAYIAMQPSSSVDADYMCYLLKSYDCARALHNMGRGLRKILNYNELKTKPLLLPPLSEQRAIVAYLNSECARIDAVIEQTRASIEEYKKLKQAVITQAVTKGIRPNRPMKDSGIEWIGDIPEDWDVRRIKNIFRLRDERNYLPLEEVNLISLYTDKGVVQHNDLEQTTGNKASNADGYKKVYKNDIVVNIILCWMGAIGISDYDGVTSPAYDIYVPSNEIECRFYHHYFRTTGFSGDCYKRGRGIMAMRWRTYSDQFRDIRVVVPPIKEQKQILNYLDSMSSGIEEMIDKKQRFLSDLECYKKSLIYMYVTGKKDDYHNE